jgi:hypothetical protein
MKVTWRELAATAGYPAISAGVMAHRLKRQFRGLNAEDKVTFILAVRFAAKFSEPNAVEEALTKMKRDSTEEWQTVGAIRLMDVLYASPFFKKAVKRERVPRLSSTTGSGGIKIE